MNGDELAELIEEYAVACVLWREQQSDSRRANKTFRRIQEIQKSLRENEEGRLAIEALTADERIEVRTSAAVHTLAWAPEVGEPVLRSIAAATPRVTETRAAELVLREYWKGTLDLDW